MPFPLPRRSAIPRLAVLLILSAAMLMAKSAHKAAATHQAASTSPGLIRLHFRDRESGHGVAAFLKITSAESPAAAPVLAQSDDAGDFQIELPPGRYSLQAAAPGFDPVELKWNEHSVEKDVLLSRETAPKGPQPKTQPKSQLEPQPKTQLAPLLGTGAQAPPLSRSQKPRTSAPRAVARKHRTRSGGKHRHSHSAGEPTHGDTEAKPETGATPPTPAPNP